MTDQEKQVVSEPSKLTPEQVIARRNFLKWGLIGGLAVLPVGLHFMRASYKNKMYKVVLYPPFPVDDKEEYVVGIPNWETRGRSQQNTFSNNQSKEMRGIRKEGSLGKIELCSIRTIVGDESDIVEIAYKYGKTLTPPKRIDFECTIEDGTGALLGLGNRSIVAKRLKESEIPIYGSRKVYQSYVDILKIDIPKNTKNSISAITIITTEMPFQS